MPDSFMLYNMLGLSPDQVVEITKRTFKLFMEHNKDVQELCKVVAETHDPESLLVGALIEKICSANDELYAMDEKQVRRRRFN